MYTVRRLLLTPAAARATLHFLCLFSFAYGPRHTLQLINTHSTKTCSELLSLLPLCPQFSFSNHAWKSQIPPSLDEAQRGCVIHGRKCHPLQRQYLFVNNSLKPRHFPVSSCLEFFKSDFPDCAPPLLLIMTLLGYQLFSLGQWKCVKPYFSHNVTSPFMDFKYVILHGEQHPKAWRAERLSCVTSQEEILHHSFPIKQSQRKGVLLLVLMLRDFCLIVLC